MFSEMYYIHYKSNTEMSLLYMYNCIDTIVVEDILETCLESKNVLN